MTDTPRVRRPIPNRTHPNRGILGVFGQSSWKGADSTGHPLGPGFSESTGPDDTYAYLDDQVQEALDIVNRNIDEDARARAQEDDGVLGKFADLYSGVQGGDLTHVVATLTRTYADMAGKWVELASTVTEGLSQLRSQQKSAAPSGPMGAAGPVLSIRAAVPVEARIEMFRPALSLTPRPLGSDDASNAARITEVVAEDGRIKLRVPADQPAGVYYGLLIEDGVGPAGVITVEVLTEDAP